MVCIYCSSETQVINSRLQKRSNQVWRRRRCASCGNTFTTHEAPDLSTGIAVHYSAHNIEPFIRDMLFASIYESCKHRKTAISDANALTQTVIAALRPHVEEGVLERDTIAAVTLAVLERFDKPAATMYAAYHPISRP